MSLLVARVRAALPFGDAAARVCRGDCRICGLKLLDDLDGQLSAWDQPLATGETPTLGDL